MSEEKLPVLSSESGFLNYLQAIRSIPSLGAEEEYMLAKRFAEHGDTTAAHKLVLSHLKLVPKVALTYKGYGLPMVELVSEGNIGLMHAVKKFSPDKGFRLTTYAVWWIKASIQEYILKSWSLVKIGTTAAQKKLFFNLGKVKRKIRSGEIEILEGDEYQTIAKELGVSREEVAQMDLRMGRDTYLDDPLGVEENSDTLLDTIASNHEDHGIEYEESQLQDLKKQAFSEAMNSLNEREQYIINQRKLKEEPATLDDLSKELNISRERVRQIEARAFEKLQKFMLDYKHLNDN